MARGPKPKIDAKRRIVMVRYEDSEHDAIKTYASKKGFTVASLVREAVKTYLEQNNAPTSVTIQDPNQLRIE